MTTDALTGRALDAAIHEALWPRHNIADGRYCDGYHDGDNCHWQPLPGYSTDHAAAHEVENEIERRGLAYVYAEKLARIVGVALDCVWEDPPLPAELLLLIRATPEQRCRAALAVVGEG